MYMSGIWIMTHNNNDISNLEWSDNTQNLLKPIKRTKRKGS